MIGKTPDTLKHQSFYRSPDVKEIPVSVKSVLCYSGNESAREHDYGTGGFVEG